MDFREDGKISQRVGFILSNLDLSFIHSSDIFCVSSLGSKSRAIARIYGFPRVFQLALNRKPIYVIEVISERFDKLSQENKDRVLIHELMHIPKTFSGALVPHKCFGKRRICDKTVEVLYQKFRKNCYE